MEKLKEKILSAPDACGVYLMRDKAGNVLYVGKAKSLKKRLLSYLPGLIGSAGTRCCAVTKDLSTKTVALISKVTDIEFRLSANEAMALLLESSLIHEFKPKYNISLKDDKSFPFIKISKEKFPSLCITRNKKDIEAIYFGPYTDAKLLKSALKIIRKNFAFRSCKHMPKQSCVYHRIKLCQAPCTGKISYRQYKANLNRIILILEGRGGLLIQELNKLMHSRAKAFDFETAARIRDQIVVLSDFSANPKSSDCEKELEDLKNKLGLKKLPLRIEGFDISNISGNQAVGSMVSFYKAIADKNNYRRFRIKSFKGIDDYKMLAEIVRRRFSRLLRENKPFPDLVLIDGGKAHLLTAAREISNLHLHIPLVSIAKEKENIYSSQKSCELNFPKDSPAINLIRRVRDEAHRFALGYHHLLRNKDLLK